MVNFFVFFYNLLSSDLLSIFGKYSVALTHKLIYE